MSRGKKSQRQSNVIVVAEDMWRQLHIYIVLKPNNSTSLRIYFAMLKYLCLPTLYEQFTIVNGEVNEEWSTYGWNVNDHRNMQL